MTDAIVQHQATAAADRRLIAEILALVGGTSARSTLLQWSQDEDAAVRAAAWRAIGTTGMDDRVSYHALRALSDPDPRVRAHAGTMALWGCVPRVRAVLHVCGLEAPLNVCDSEAEALQRLSPPR